MSVGKLKGLQVRLNKMLSEADLLKADISRKQKELALKNTNIQDIKKQIQSLNSPTSPRITEHAYLRYLERVKGNNLAEIEAEIITPELMKMIDILGGSGTFPSNGFNIVMKEYNIITITQ